MHIPPPSKTIASLIDDVHVATAEDWRRPHLGASLLGHECDRFVWLSFRWAVAPQFPGRILRLFRRGHREEETIIADLKRIGVVFDETSSRKVELGGHLGGEVDGIILSGVLEAPKKKHILECKTHSLKSFKALEKDGLQKSKPMHYAQTQLYMHGKGIDRALYFAVCKDDDSIYTERVRYDDAFCLALIQRGQRISLDDHMPMPISADPSWYVCKMCPAYDMCHGSKLSRQVNCRTCAMSTATKDGKWECGRFGVDEIPVENQKEGCECHVISPELVPWKRVPSKAKWTAVYKIGDAEVSVGEPDAFVISSQELVDHPEKFDLLFPR